MSFKALSNKQSRYQSAVINTLRYLVYIGLSKPVCLHLYWLVGLQDGKLSDKLDKSIDQSMSAQLALEVLKFFSDRISCVTVEEWPGARLYLALNGTLFYDVITSCWALDAIIKLLTPSPTQTVDCSTCIAAPLQADIFKHDQHKKL